MPGDSVKNRFDSVRFSATELDFLALNQTGSKAGMPRFRQGYGGRASRKQGAGCELKIGHREFVIGHLGPNKSL